MNEAKVSDRLKSNYDGYYEDGDSELRRLCAVAKADNIVALCKDLPRHSVLEIGAGEGSILKRLSEVNFGEELYGLEISSTGVRTIQNKGIQRLVECKLYDGYRVPYEDNKFDIVILSHVVEHLEHPRQLLYEAARVAKYIFVEVPLEDTVRLKQDFVLDSVGHINYYSPKTIRRLLQSCNLRVLQQVTLNPRKETYAFRSGFKGLLHYRFKQTLIKTMPRLAPRLLCYNGALVCEKNPD